MVLWIKRRLRDPLIKNSLALLLNSGFNAMAGFLFWILVARLYPPAEVGLAAALIASLGLIYTWSNFGLSFGLVRFLPVLEDKKRAINTCLTITAAGAGLGALVFILGVTLWTPALSGLRTQMAPAAGFFLFAIVWALFLSQKSVFVALRAAELSLVQQIPFGILRLALPVALVSLGGLGIFTSYGIAVLLATLLGFFLLARKLPGYAPAPSLYKKVINEVAHFSFGNFVAEAIGNLPIYLLPLVIVAALGAEANAYFYTAYVVGSMLFMIPVGVTIALLAEGAHLPGQLRSNTIKALKLILLALLPAVAVLFFLGDRILLFFGPRYAAEAWGTLRLLALASIPLGLNEVWIMVKRVQLRLRALILSYLATATLIIGFSYPLMKIWGAEGVGWGWLIGETLMALFFWGGVIRHNFKRVLLPRFSRGGV